MPQLPDVPLDGLYGDLVMKHFRSPRNSVLINDADVEGEEFNPFCGDRVTLQFRLDGQGRVVEASAQSEGCSIIQASASMLADIALGMSVAELENLDERFRAMMKNGLSAEEGDHQLGDLHSLQVVRQFPVRIKCALLPWTALAEGIKGFQSKT